MKLSFSSKGREFFLTSIIIICMSVCVSNVLDLDKEMSESLFEFKCACERL